MSKRKIFIGVAWPYVNGTLHIGHFAGYLLPADICSRFHRLMDEDVLMVSGSDCFGTPTTVEADKRGITPQEVVDEYHNKDVDVFLNTCDLQYDLYSKTQHPNHIQVTQDFFVKMLEEGYIFIDTTCQYYSRDENRFLPDRYVVGECPFCHFKDARSDQCDECGKLITHGELINPRSNLTGSTVELKDSEHYFVDWPKLQTFLEDYVRETSGNWKEWIRAQTKAWLEEGLRPRAITRDLDWGVLIPVERIPEDKQLKDPDSKRIYVWFDAVIGYLSGSKLWAQKNGTNWEPFWYDQDGVDLKHYYFMGKDNLVFHTLFWPGQLHVYDPELHLPDVQSINMFLDLGGKQFSKSRGISIDIKEIVEQYGNDPVRFYLTLIMPEVRDASFTWQDFEEKVNGILVGNLGNFIHRVLSVGKTEKMESLVGRELSHETEAKINDAFASSIVQLENCKFRDYVDTVLQLSQYGNELVDKAELWHLKAKDEDAFYGYLFELYAVIMALGYLTAPVTPWASKDLAEMFGVEYTKWPVGDDFSAEVIDKLLTARIPTDPKPLFKKIEV